MRAPAFVTRVVAVGSMGFPMPLPAGLDALWQAESAQAVAELITFSARRRRSGVAARETAMLAQPWYPDLFPAPRQRWVDDLALSREELAGIAAPVLLVHGAQDRVVPLRDSFLGLIETLPDVRGHVFGRCGHALAAGTHRRIQPTADDFPGDRPMTDFAILRAPSEVLFGAGMAAAAGRVAASHGHRVLVITDPVIAATPGFATVTDSLSALDVTIFSDAVVDVPRSAVDAAVALGESVKPDVIVAVGGGSVIDLAKVTALLLAHGGPLENYYAVQSVPGPVIPLIALPTTAGTGSEATPCRSSPTRRPR